MIPRYSTPEMSAIWSEESKFLHWLRVELAVLQAKEDLDLIPKGIFNQIQQQAQCSAAHIEAIEAETHHDLLAFVQCVQESLDSELRHYFHADLTSYDTEEPALALIFRDAIGVVVAEMSILLDTLLDRAHGTRAMTCIDRSHGQHAEPSVFAVHFLRNYDPLCRLQAKLTDHLSEIVVGKISGAVGTYAGKLSPELEKRALEILGVAPVQISGQIIHRDRHAAVLQTLALIATDLENLAVQIRLLSKTEVGEVQEPFSSKQKGSSRMPHKKNPILSENLCGLSRLVRGYAGIALENIVTWDARDISQSSVERVIFPDAFHIVHFMIRRMTRVIAGLVIHPESVERNLGMTKGAYYSGEVKEALMEEGLDPESAYHISQTLAFQSLTEGRSYRQVFLESDDVPLAARERRNEIFNPHRFLKHIPDILKRFDISM